MGLEAGSQLKSQGKWLGVVGTFLWDFTYLCLNLTYHGKVPALSDKAVPAKQAHASPVSDSGA